MLRAWPYTTVMRSEPAGKQAIGRLGPRPVPEGLRRASDRGPRSAIEVYGWQVRGKPVSIKIPIDVIEYLEADIAHGLSLGAPCDVSGLLIGRIVTGSGSTFIVEDYELSGYSRENGGPPFGSDEKLAEMVERWSKRQGPRHVVGFFRSQRRGWPTIDREDSKAAKRLLKRNQNIFLVIRSAVDRDYMGVLFLRQGRSATVEEEHGEFSFNANVLRALTEKPARMEEPSAPFVEGSRVQEMESADHPGRIMEVAPAAPLVQIALPFDDAAAELPVLLSPAPATIPEETIEAPANTNEPAEVEEAPPFVSLWTIAEETPQIEAGESLVPSQTTDEPLALIDAETVCIEPWTPVAEEASPIVEQAQELDFPAEPTKESLWARIAQFFVREAPLATEEAPPLVEETPKLDIPAGPAKPSFWARIAQFFVREAPQATEEAPPLVEETPKLDIPAEPAKPSFWARISQVFVKEAPQATEAAQAEEARPLVDETPKLETPAEPAKPGFWARTAEIFVKERPQTAPADSSPVESQAAEMEQPTQAAPNAASQPPADEMPHDEPLGQVSEPPKYFKWSDALNQPIELFAEPTSSNERAISYTQPARRAKSAKAEEEDASEDEVTAWFTDDSTTPPTLSRRSWLSLAATWAVAVGVTMWCMDGRSLFPARRAEMVQTRPVTISNPIGLLVNKRGDLLDIAWDRSLAAAMNSRGGFLTIRDGKLLKEIQLDSLEIQTGHVYYQPRSADLGIRLEVAEDDGGTASESVRILGPSTSARQRLNR
jgi:hypothetical protein